ncbi:MAG: class I SAM-dependent methyltransferase [Desulfitobacteriaceae bacterium]|nr:class I SAM-dependent methyltransferase [Desulfitobacteriaceae bacterium]
MFEEYLSKYTITERSPLYRTKVLFERNPKYKEWYIKRAKTTVDNIINQLGTQEGLLLDVGCGMGWLSVGIEKRTNCKCVGVDVERELIMFSNARAKYEGANTTFLLADGGGLPFKDKRFDFVGAIDVLEHVKDYMQCLKEIVRVLNVGGKRYL